VYWEGEDVDWGIICVDYFEELVCYGVDVGSLYWFFFLFWVDCDWLGILILIGVG